MIIYFLRAKFKRFTDFLKNSIDFVSRKRYSIKSGNDGYTHQQNRNIEQQISDYYKKKRERKLARKGKCKCQEKESCCQE